MTIDSGRVGKAETGSREPSPSSSTAGLGPTDFDPARVRGPLKRIQELAATPGTHTGPVFDEIWALAASCLATMDGGDRGND